MRKNIKKIVMLLNDTTYAYNLRGALIKELIAEGYEVVVVCQTLLHVEKLNELGARLIDVDIDRNGKNPLKDLGLMMKYWKILRGEKPSVVLTYNIKPNSYGGAICKMLKLPYIPNITGLGTPIENPGKIQKLAMMLYKSGVSKASCVMFQNEENRQFFIEHKMIKEERRSRIIPGSGVDLDRFPYLEWNDTSFHFLFAARIMKEKGIDSFIAAARKLASDKIIFDVCGKCDDDEYKDILDREKTICYHGEQADLTQFYRLCSCFLFPSSYPEGMSNVLLEAAASGRPIITTNRAGCRETVEDGVSGIVVPLNDADSVILAAQRLLAMSDEERKNMGLAGRIKMEKEFNRSIVVNAYIEEIESILGA